MLQVPAVIPVTTPEVVPTVAIDVALLAHVPPAGEPERVIVEPAHITVPPPMIDAPVVTVKANVA